MQQVAGLKVSITSKSQLFEVIVAAVREQRRISVCHVNARMIRLSRRAERWIQQWFQQGDVEVMCDSTLPRLALRLQGSVIPERLAFNRWMDEFLGFAERAGIAVYFFGATVETLSEVKARIASEWPLLKVAGSQHGYVDWDSAHGAREVIAAINSSAAQVLFVALGMPAQERFIAKHRGEIRANVVLPCGGALDFLSRRVPTAPRWIAAIGMEWLYRGLREPRRLLLRNLQDVASAAAFLLVDSFAARRTRRRT